MCEAIIPTKKMEDIINMISPTTRQGVRNFIGFWNFHCAIRDRRSYTLKPLINLTSTNINCKLIAIEQNISM